eukprot:10146464-Karenia_brevis.AAC.1
MSGRRFGGECEWSVWVAGVRSNIKRIVRSATGDIIDCALAKFFRFAGHIARSRVDVCIRLATVRGQGFISAARTNKHCKPAYCRSGGTQLPVYDDLLWRFFHERGSDDWAAVARDRDTWKSPEKAFTEFARHTMSFD